LLHQSHDVAFPTACKALESVYSVSNSREIHQIFFVAWAYFTLQHSIRRGGMSNRIVAARGIAFGGGRQQATWNIRAQVLSDDNEPLRERGISRTLDSY
jgi:hypothetical protein